MNSEIILRQKAYWEKRSSKYKDKIEGVLFKSLPGAVNNYLDKWTWSEIKNGIDCADAKKILDLGAGYGRLSRKVVRYKPKATLRGVDISRNYVDLYNKKLGPKHKSVVGSIDALPFKDNSFDMAFMSITLVCLLDKKRQKKALAEMIRVIKPGGCFVFIESNKFIHRMIMLNGILGEVTRDKNGRPLIDITPEFIENEFDRLNCKIIRKRGIPAWTFGLPIVILSDKISSSLSKDILKVIELLGMKIGFLYKASLYFSLTGVKKSEK